MRAIKTKPNPKLVSYIGREEAMKSIHSFKDVKERWKVIRKVVKERQEAREEKIKSHKLYRLYKIVMRIAYFWTLFITIPIFSTIYFGMLGLAMSIILIGIYFIFKKRNKEK